MLTIDQRGLYGQVESSESSQVANAERFADVEAEANIGDSQADFTKRMAMAWRRQHDHARSESRLNRRISGAAFLAVQISRTCQRAELETIASLTEEMRSLGFSHQIIVGTINSSEFLARQQAAEERNTTCASATKPALAVTKTAFDGNGSARMHGNAARVMVINTAARSGSIDRYRDPVF